MRRFVFGLLVGVTLHAAHPVTNEAERIRALSSIFPQMKITVGDPYPIPARKPGELIVFPDALDGQKVYHVVGPASGEAELCAAGDVATMKRSDARELRFVIYHWPKSADILAILQYRFTGIESPAGACWSIGRIVHLAGGHDAWRVTENRDLDTQHHAGLERVELTDVSGDGTDDLLIESDWGGAGTAGSSLLIFSLQEGRLTQELEVVSRMEGLDESFTQPLDLGRTRKTQGKRFCFTKTDLGSNGQLYRDRPISRPCYPRGTRSGPN